MPQGHQPQGEVHQPAPTSGRRVQGARGKASRRRSAPRHRPSRSVRHPLRNADIARALREMSLFLSMDDVPFKPEAYERAAQSIATLEQPVARRVAEKGAKAFDDVPGIGKGIARRVTELLETGRWRELEDQRRAMPVDVIALTEVEGLGPKQVKRLYDALGVKNLDELEEAARTERIRHVPHFGAKTERKILRSLEFVREVHGRRPLGDVLELGLEIEARLRKLPAASRAELAGSLRRRKETIGDLDFLVASSDPERITEAFVRMPEVEHVYARGPTKTLVRLRAGIDADLRVVVEDSWGAALCYFTGSKAHNVTLRRIAQARDLKLNEYGLFRGDHAIAGRTEQEIYAALDLDWVPPELRENTGEIEAAAEGTLPNLITADALRGDLQLQTRWTDGANTLEEMADAARRLGLEYIAITDHTRDLLTAGGINEARLLEQLEAVRALDARLDDIRVLAGAEVNIRSDGSLDIRDEVLAQLDLVGAGVHTYLQQSREEMTARLIRAMENPHVDILFHPTSRALGRRPACEIDMDALFEAAQRTGTALEIDAQPMRLDLKDDYVRQAIRAGVSLVIDSNAHSVQQLRYARDFGVAVARRGWATAHDILNTRPLDGFLQGLKGHPHP